MYLVGDGVVVGINVSLVVEDCTQEAKEEINDENETVPYLGDVSLVLWTAVKKGGDTGVLCLELEEGEDLGTLDDSLAIV